MASVGSITVELRIANIRDLHDLESIAARLVEIADGSPWLGLEDDARRLREIAASLKVADK